MMVIVVMTAVVMVAVVIRSNLIHFIAGGSICGVGSGGGLNIGFCGSSFAHHHYHQHHQHKKPHHPNQNHL